MTTPAPSAPYTWRLLLALWRALAPPHRRRAALVAALTVVCVGSELATLETLRLLLQGAVAGDGLGRGLRWPLLAFLLSALALTGLRLVSLRANERLLLAVAGDFSRRLFRGAIRQPLAAQQQQETAELFAGLDKTQALANSVLGPLLSTFAQGGVALALAAYLFWIAPLVTGVGATVLLALYLLLGRVTGPRLTRGSREVARLASERMRRAHEAQGGFRDLVLSGAQAQAEEEFERIETRYRRAQGDTRFLAVAPRPLVEMVVLLMVGALAIYLTRDRGAFAALVPLAGTLAVGAQRLIPMLNAAHVGWAQFLGGTALLGDVLALLARPLLATPARGIEPLPLQQEFALEGVGLRYPGREWLFRQLDLRIPRGARIGLMGATGAGKSSLLDLLIGLAQPDEGVLRVDGRVLDDATLRARWQAGVALVPQSIYLPDRSLRESIAFPAVGDGIDPARLQQAVADAQLEAFVASLPDGLETRVGDRGMRLSGGQRQRIALARALYRRPAVLVLDEATGQLDADTEQAVLGTLAALDPATTIIVVSHRPAAFSICRQVYRLRQGRLVEVASPETSRTAP